MTGNYREVETDLQFNTPHEKDFKIYRTYKSRLETDTTLGYGWTHNYNVTMDLFLSEETNAYQITDESGRTHHYQDNGGDGLYNGILSSKGYLAAELDGSFTWYRANDITYTFDADLNFVAKTDGNGNVQSLTYNTDGLLETVTDEATGRSIGFVYNTEGRIENITGPVTDAVADGVWVTYQYDTEGNLNQVIYADDGNGSGASGFEYFYDDANDVHNLTEKRNLAGEFLSSWAYDASDRAYENVTRDGKGVTISGYGTSSIVVTDAQGVEKTYTIATINGRQTITDITGDSGCASCGGDAVRYGYDDERRVTEIEYASGRIDQYADFDASGRYTTEIKAAGTDQARTFHYTYHPDTGDRLSITEASILGSGDKETIFDYDDDGNDIPNESPTRLMHRKIERGYTYDDTGAVAAFEYITTYTYDAKGNVLEIDGPLSGDQDKVSYTYDAVTGDRLSETRPLTGTTYYSYDDAGNVETVTDVNSVVTTFTYDGRNRQMSVTRNGVAQSRTYTAAGELDTTTDALSRTMNYTYNTAGFMEKIVDPSGNFIYYGYNSLGQREEESIYAADQTQTHYRGTDWGDPANNTDLAAGKPWKSIHRSSDDSEDLETIYTYDASGNLETVTDANTNVTSYDYDLFDRLYLVTQPYDTITTYAYDTHGNLATVTDAEGHVTTYTYDDLGRLVQTVSPDTGTTVYAYDEAGNLRYKTQNAVPVEYQYDLLGRLTNIIYTDAAQNVTLTYDSGSGSNLMGRLASVTDPSGTVQYSYDADGRLEMETRTVEGLAYVTGYGYDDAGNLRTITYPTGQTVTYQPDAADPARIGSVTLGSQTLATGLAYQPYGPVSAMTLGNGITMTKGYDKNYQLTSLSDTTVMDRTYLPDNVGNIELITDNLDATRSQSFDYDDLYRLTNANGIYGAVNFTYDKVGNRLTRTKTNGTNEDDTYRYYPGTNRLHTVTGTHAELFQYDADGNTTQRTPGANNPAPAVTDPPEFIYNSSGQRSHKAATAATIYHYDQSGQLIAETDTAGTMIKAYIWLHGQPLAQITPDGSVYYYHNDHLGTPQRLTDASGTIVWAADYLPFGTVDVTISSVENNLRFAGQYFDSETGLHYNYHRYYDPKIGRYLRPDPSHQYQAEGLAIKYLLPFLHERPEEYNGFTYTQNNPINAIDKKGLISTICPCDHVRCIAATLTGRFYHCFAKVYCKICGIELPGYEVLGRYELGYFSPIVIFRCEDFPPTVVGGYS